jgi:hypothetical protein
VTGPRASDNDLRVHLCHLPSPKVPRPMFSRHAHSPQQNGQICQPLLDNSIYLDEHAIDTTHSADVLDYLSSYHGLEKSSLHSQHSEADTPGSYHRFFSSILPLHSATLCELSLRWSVETPWTRDIGPEDLAQVETRRQLRKLSCHVTMTTGLTGRTDGLLVGSFMCTASRP